MSRTDRHISSEPHERIKNNYGFLMKNIDINEGFIDRLWASKLLDDCEVENFRQCPTDNSKLEHILDAMMRITPEQFKEFVQILRETNQEHVAAKLTGTSNTTQSVCLRHGLQCPRYSLFLDKF
jgi:hypothetical protein